MLDRYWRKFATGLCFLLFGLGGLLLSYLIFPLFSLFSKSREQSYLRCRRMVSFCFRFFILIMTGLRVMDFEQKNRPDNSSTGCLIVANHPTLIDVILLLACLPEAECVVKKEVRRNPFFSRAARQLGYIMNDFEVGVVEQCSERIRLGRMLVLFPEGTRSRAGEPGKFQRGAAAIAINCNCPIIPAIISCYPPTLEKGQRWYHTPAERPKFLLRFEPGFQAIEKPDRSGDNAGRRRSLTDSLQEYFKEEVNHERQRIIGERT